MEKYRKTWRPSHTCTPKSGYLNVPFVKTLLTDRPSILVHIVRSFPHLEIFECSVLT